MYAAVLHEYGAPRFDQFDEPQLTGDAVVVHVTAVALSQFDVVHASGQHAVRATLGIPVWRRGCHCRCARGLCQARAS